MKLNSVVSIQQFLDHAVLMPLLKSAAELEKLAENKKLPKYLEGKIVATLFYEPSTRTRFSFETAVLQLGGQVISGESAGQFSSAAKGETLADTARVIGGYADALIIRHPQRGSAQECAQYATIPVINAGDGAGEHPTQALLDIYTIQKELGRLEDITVTLVGDLLNGRTVHSLLPLLATFPGIKINLVSPSSLALPLEQVLALPKQLELHVYKNLDSVLDSSDIFYITRIQKERMADEAAYNKVKDAFVLTLTQMQKMKKTARIMHPLPRVNEISPEVDSDPRAAYFRQAANGVCVRMALLKMLLHD